MNCIINAWGNYEAELRGFLINKVSNKALAEDILQETFLRAVSEGSQFCTLENPRAWLFRVARNRLIDTARLAESRLVTEELPEQVEDKFEEIQAVQSLDICLPKALLRLNEDDQKIIKNCDIDGQTQLEFAENNGLTLVATKSRIQRARKRLKSELITLCKVNFDDSGKVCCFASQDDLPTTGI
ncbi:MAG: sigma-70 family RNA polymerase sigma factor [bacterium]